MAGAKDSREQNSETESQEKKVAPLRLIEALTKVGAGAVKAWIKGASRLPQKPMDLTRPWEAAAVAWLDGVVMSRPALSAMFVPLGIGLVGLGQMNRVLDAWIRTWRGVSAKDMENTMNVLRSLESRLLEVSLAVEDVQDSLEKMTRKKTDKNGKK